MDKFGKRIFDGQTFNLLAVVQVFAVEAFATGAEGGGDDQGVVEAVAVTRLDIEAEPPSNPARGKGFLYKSPMAYTPPMSSLLPANATPRIGIALGSGSARGWSHIGVLNALEDAGVSPDIVCGTSIGALVGAAYAAGELSRLETWVTNLTWQAVVGLLDVKFGSGLISGAKLLDFFRAQFDDPGIARLPKAYAAVATELATGREIWLREGSVIEAVRASIALPGLFTPSQMNGRLLVDGGLVNPVPVSLCRALGADIVIAVDLNWDLVGHHHRAAALSHAPPAETSPLPAQPAPAETSPLLASILARLSLGRGKSEPKPAELPSILDVLTTSLNIMQVRITRSRLAGDPADIMIRPRLTEVALMDYHRAEPSIIEGRRAAELALPEIRELMAGCRPD